jgi:hypothetical protein
LVATIAKAIVQSVSRWRDIIGLVQTEYSAASS